MRLGPESSRSSLSSRHADGLVVLSRVITGHEVGGAWRVARALSAGLREPGRRGARGSVTLRHAALHQIKQLNRPFSPAELKTVAGGARAITACHCAVAHRCVRVASQSPFVP